MVRAADPRRRTLDQRDRRVCGILCNHRFEAAHDARASTTGSASPACEVDHRQRRASVRRRQFIGALKAGNLGSWIEIAAANGSPVLSGRGHFGESGGLVRNKDEIAFWQAQSAEFEGRARAAGTQMQTSAALAVTAVAGGLLAAGAEALLAPALAVIIAIVVWLLALICSLNWAEMKVLARRRDLANERIAELLPAVERAAFNRIRQTGARVDRREPGRHATRRAGASSSTARTITGVCIPRIIQMHNVAPIRHPVYLKATADRQPAADTARDRREGAGAVRAFEYAPRSGLLRSDAKDPHGRYHRPAGRCDARR